MNCEKCNTPLSLSEIRNYSGLCRWCLEEYHDYVERMEKAVQEEFENCVDMKEEG